MVSDAVYLNPLPNFKQCYTHYENKNQGQKIVRLNIIILTQLQSINTVAIHTRASNKLRGYEIRLCEVYVFDKTHGEVLETIFTREE